MSEVIQISEFTYDLNNKPKFEFNFNGLLEWLESVRDKPVAVIPIVGPTQIGRSLKLNLIGHHLSKKGTDEQITGLSISLNV